MNLTSFNLNSRNISAIVIYIDSGMRILIEDSELIGRLGGYEIDFEVKPGGILVLPRSSDAAMKELYTAISKMLLKGHSDIVKAVEDPLPERQYVEGKRYNLWNTIVTASR